jgi:hypothetical protein
MPETQCVVGVEKARSFVSTCHWGCPTPSLASARQKACMHGEKQHQVDDMVTEGRIDKTAASFSLLMHRKYCQTGCQSSAAVLLM